MLCSRGDLVAWEKHSERKLLTLSENDSPVFQLIWRGQSQVIDSLLLLTKGIGLQ